MKCTLTCLAFLVSLSFCQSQEHAFSAINTNESGVRPVQTTSDSALLFKMAQIMAVLGDYQSAALYQQKIVGSYPGLDVRNHAGVIFVLAALDGMDKKKVPYILPLELDAKTRLAASTARVPISDSLQQSLLKDAVRQFDLALALDENFVNAYRNKGCALALLGKFDEAITCLDKGIAHCSTQRMKPDFFVVKGIVAALQGNKSEAIELTKLALSIGSYLAAQNLAIMEGKVAPKLTLQGPAPIKGTEQIEWYPLDAFLANPTAEETVWINDSIRCGKQQKQGSNVYVHFEEKTKKYTLVQETNSKYSGATLRAIIMESTADNIQEAYGVPDRDIVLPEGRAWVYPGANIFFLFDHRRVLKGWGVYLRG